MTSRAPGRWVAAAGWLLLLAVTGTVAVEWLWWALVPAAALLAFGFLRPPAYASQGAARIGSLVVVNALLLLLAGTVAGLAVESRLGIEPAWVGWMTAVAGFGIMIGAAILGVAIIRHGRGLRLAGLFLTLGLPVGFGVDWIFQAVLPPGLFLNGAGFYIGMVMFAGVLIRLGHNERSLVT